MKILIIDKDDFLQRIIQDYFSNKEHSVDIITNSYSLIERLNNSTCDLIILNFKLDKINWEFICDLIKSWVPLPRILLISGQYSNEEYYSCLKYKIYPDGFIYVPVEPERVHITLDKLMKRMESLEGISEKSFQRKKAQGR